jgi:hypothetical protein
MQNEQKQYENQLQSAGYVMRDTGMMTPGQPITTFLDFLAVPYYLHTDPVTPDVETNHPYRPLWQFGGVGHNVTSVRHERPRAQSVTQSRVNQVLRQLGFLR